MNWLLMRADAALCAPTLFILIVFMLPLPNRCRRQGLFGVVTFCWRDSSPLILFPAAIIQATSRLSSWRDHLYGSQSTKLRSDVSSGWTKPLKFSSALSMSPGFSRLQGGARSRMTRPPRPTRRRVYDMQISGTQVQRYLSLGLPVGEKSSDSYKNETI